MSSAGPGTGWGALLQHSGSVLPGRWGAGCATHPTPSTSRQELQEPEASRSEGGAKGAPPDHARCRVAGCLLPSFWDHAFPFKTGTQGQCIPAKHALPKPCSLAALCLAEQTHSRGKGAAPAHGQHSIRPCRGQGERKENTQPAPGPRLSDVFSH